MNLDEEFGPAPGRPTHPDMARLSAIIRRNDKAAEQPGFDLEDFLRLYADPETVLYLAKQRVLRMSQTPGMGQEAKLLAAWIDGATLGLAASARDLPRDGQRRPR